MLPAEARKRNTVWVAHGEGRAKPIRCAAEGEELVCFGDDGLAAVPAGATVTATIHEIHCGPPLVSFTAKVRELEPGDVSLGLLAEVVGHRSLGLTYEETIAALERMRHERRIVALRP